MGKERKKGKKGIAANYITRTRALRKLQITLKDFRRLCILKGIYPRAPKKVNQGRDKTYYHIKDIAYLQYEPVLEKFRQIKTYIKKHKRLIAKGRPAEAKAFEKRQPKIVLDHLIKERYPEFTDAIRDLDDPLSMTYLFASLPSRLATGHTPERVALCVRLCREWETVVSRTKALDKVFVSIKGTYYQATIQGQSVVWLVPHRFKQHLPDDVDYRVMLTFLQFYETMLTFVNFKLFHDEGLHYPPRLDEIKDASRFGLGALEIQTLQEKAREATSRATNDMERSDDEDEESDEEDDEDMDEEEDEDDEEEEAPTERSTKELRRGVKGVVSKLASADAKARQAREQAINDREREEQEEALAGIDDFSTLDPSAPVPSLGDLPNQFFNGLVFLLGRETPQDSLEFVILCGGGKVHRQGLNTVQEDDSSITHQISDRKTIRNPVSTREYVQPQWVYDSFNCKATLPVEPYKPGMKPPAHLSPFVDDDAEGYVPKQRKVLEQWASAKALKSKPVADEEEEEEQKQDSEDEDSEDEARAAEAQEAAYESGLRQERQGKRQSNDDDDSEDDDDEDEQDDDDESESEEEVKETPKQRRKREQEEKRKEMAVGMMTSKKGRLYAKMQYGIERKKKKASSLLAKRKAIEAEAQPKKKQKKKTDKKRKKKKTN